MFFGNFLHFMKILSGWVGWEIIRDIAIYEFGRGEGVLKYFLRMKYSKETFGRRLRGSKTEEKIYWPFLEKGSDHLIITVYIY